MPVRKSFPVGLALFLLYFLVFPHRSGLEFFVVPIKSQEISLWEKERKTSSPLSNPTGILLKDWVGHLDKDTLKILSLRRREAPVMVSETFSLEAEDPRVLVIRDRWGKRRDEILNSGGRIDLLRDRFLTSDYRLGLLAMRNSEGRLFWRRRYPAPLTTFSTTKTHLLGGFLDGTVSLFDEKGILLAHDQIEGSRLDVVYGVALSSDLARWAVISGLDPQRFLLYEKGQEGWVSTFDTEIKAGFKRRRLMEFSADGESVYYEGRERFFIQNLRRNRVKEVPLLRETLLEISEASSFDLLFLRTAFLDSGGGAIRLLSREGDLLFRFLLPHSSSFFTNWGRLFLFSLDNTLVVMELREG